MKTIYKHRLLSLAIALSFSSLAQDDTQANQNEERQKVEKNTAPFTLEYFTKPSNRYLVMTLAVKQGKIVPDQTARVQEVMGKMPYPTGNLSVRIVDVQGEVLSEYTMQDPLILRSCEDEKSELQPRADGTVQLMLPANANAATIVLMRGKETVQQVDIKDILDRYRRDPNKPDEENEEGQ